MSTIACTVFLSLDAGTFTATVSLPGLPTIEGSGASVTAAIQALEATPQVAGLIAAGYTMEWNLRT